MKTSGFAFPTHDAPFDTQNDREYNDYMFNVEINPRLKDNE